MLLFFSNYFYSFYVNSVPCRPGESNQQPFNNKTLALSHSCPTSRMHSWIFIYFIRTFSQCDWSRSAFRNTSVERKHVGRFQRYQSAKITFPDRESDTGNPSHWPSGNPCKPVRKFWIYRTKSWSALGTSRTWSNKWSAGDCFHNCYKCLTLRNQKKAIGQVVFHWQRRKDSFFIQVFECCEAVGCSKSEHGSKTCEGLCEILCAAVSKLQVSGCMQWYQYRSLLMLQAQK